VICDLSGLFLLRDGFWILDFGFWISGELDLGVMAEVGSDSMHSKAV